ncbi:hypothetical protein VYU27_000940 [Nannochloropsis oceanica]
MLTPLHWVWNGPLALGWVVGSSIVFPVLRKLGLAAEPNTLDFTNDMRGKTIIVTGSNTGIGKATALNIAKMGATVVLACRSLERAKAAQEDMLVALKALDTSRYDFPFAAKGTFVCLPLDLSSFASIKAFAQEYRAKLKRLDALVLNAGLANGSGTTKEGFEVMMGTNYLGHFYLVKLLLDVLKATPDSRVVSVSSLMHEFGCLDWQGSLQNKYSSLKDRLFSSRYNDSKLALVLLTLELRHRLKGTSVRAVAVSPGAVASDIWRSFPSWYKRLVLDPVSSLAFLSNEQGSIPSVHAATHRALPLEDNENETDVLYFHPYWSPSSRFLMPFEVMGPFHGFIRAGPRLPANARAVAKELWYQSDKLVIQHAPA